MATTSRHSTPQEHSVSNVLPTILDFGHYCRALSVPAALLSDKKLIILDCHVHSRPVNILGTVRIKYQNRIGKNSA